MFLLLILIRGGFKFNQKFVIIINNILRIKHYFTNKSSIILFSFSIRLKRFDNVINLNEIWRNQDIVWITSRIAEFFFRRAKSFS